MRCLSTSTQGAQLGNAAEGGGQLGKFINPKAAGAYRAGLPETGRCPVSGPECCPQPLLSLNGPLASPVHAEHATSAAALGFQKNFPEAPRAEQTPPRLEEQDGSPFRAFLQEHPDVPLTSVCFFVRACAKVTVCMKLSEHTGGHPL